MSNNPWRNNHNLWREPSKSEVDAMNSITANAQEWATEPGSGKGTVKAQLLAAERALKGVPAWRIREAFYGRAGSWGAAAFVEMGNAYERWKAKQAERLSAETRDAIAALSSQREYLASTDETLHQEQIAALDYAISRLSSGD